ncbi:hypothetical protein GCM10023094_56280 [Rhodococcus olei]|uniref:Uncharacterized protein n=1 Tax=Rhodococcus olei TaxID=2161675 RepID=A0ABP8PSJ5_9NOCA
MQPQAWHTRSAGDGARGIRLFDWARVTVQGAGSPEQDYWLLARRSCTSPTDLAHYLCNARNVPLAATSLQSPELGGRSRKPSSELGR